MFHIAGKRLQKEGWIMMINQNLKRNFLLVKKAFYLILEKNHKYRDARFMNNSIGKDCSLGHAILNGNCSLGNRVRLVGDITIGKYTTVGEGGVLFGGKIDVGNYCQFGPRIGIYSINHPMNYVTTYVNSNLFDGELKSLVHSEPVWIGNDVWIGDGALILPGVKIGNGAVIGGGSVVVKDIEPYGIAVGNPARVIKKRLPPDIINLLEAWAWWNFVPDVLEKYKSVFFLDAIEKEDELRKALINIMQEKQVLA